MKNCYIFLYFAQNIDCVHVKTALKRRGWLSGIAPRVRDLPPPCCVLEQDTLLPESTGNTQETVAPSRHD